MSTRLFVRLQSGCALVFGLVGASCLFTTTPAASAALVYGVSQQNILLSWDSSSPGTATAGIPVFGLEPNEHVQGIDFRPATGELYALGSFSRLYKINVNTGAATLVGSGAFTPGLNGNDFGFDFNPVVDRIRVVSETDQNMRLHPDTGTVVGVDTNLAFASGDTNAAFNPNVVDVAYTNNFGGAIATTLYGIDTGRDVLVRIGSVDGSPISPNSGQLFTIGSLGVDVAADGGFDIITDGSNIAYAVLRPVNLSVSHFYSINLTTGLATDLGEVRGGLNIRAMAIIPTPGSLSLMGVGLLIAVPRRRRNS
jgi:3D (Asp-Asp-Asp) domain-containing protein